MKNILSSLLALHSLLILLLSFAGPSYASPETDEEVLSPPINSSPVTSPNGQSTIFVSDATGQLTLWIAPGRGAPASPFINWQGSDQKDPDWSPDGKFVVFTSSRGGKFNIWITTAQATNPVQLTSGAGNNEYPRFSPSGDKVAFTSDRTGKREIWVMNRDGTNAKAVGLQSLLVSDPTWSPNGNEIAFVGCTRPPNGGSLSQARCNLFSIATDASTSRQLTTGQYMDWNPDWGPGGILFSTSRSGGRSVWLLDASQVARPIPGARTGADVEPRWNRATGEFNYSTSDANSSIWSSTLGGTRTIKVSVKGRNASGDANGDGIVDCNDLAVIREAFGSSEGQPRYDLRADIVADKKIDARDLASVGKKLPTGTVCKP